MLRKELRLFRKDGIADVFRKGVFLNFGDILLKFKKNNQKISRVGIFVGTKYSKRATERNTLKRKISASIEKKYPKIKKGFDIAVIPSKNFKKNLSHKEVDNLIGAALEKAVLIIK
jgi:ribonuclease P protein component